jgi:hypothetical protein
MCGKERLPALAAALTPEETDARSETPPGSMVTTDRRRSRIPRSGLYRLPVVFSEKRLAALRPWPDEKGRYSAARTLEDYWYRWKHGGFAALRPKSRGDEGAFRKLPADAGQWLLGEVSQYPEIPLTVLYERRVTQQTLTRLRQHNWSASTACFVLNFVCWILGKYDLAGSRQGRAILAVKRPNFRSLHHAF